MTKVRLPSVQEILQSARDTYRRPLLARDQDVIDLAVWAAAIVNGSPLDVGDVGLGLIELLEDLKGLPLSPEERLDQFDMEELASLTDKTGQDAWVTYLTGCNNRIRGIAPPLLPPPPPEPGLLLDDEPEVVEEEVIEGATTRVPRCDDEPLPGHLDRDDPDDAPVHGTYNRYISRVFKCRCPYCHQAYREYRKELKQRKKERHEDCNDVPGWEASVTSSNVSAAGSSTSPHHEDVSPSRSDSAPRVLVS